MAGRASSQIADAGSGLSPGQFFLHCYRMKTYNEPPAVSSSQAPALLVNK